MQWRDLNLNPQASTLRWFGVFAMLFLLAVALSQQWRGNGIAALALLLLAVSFGAVGMVRPALLRLVYVTSLIVTFPIGWLVSRILLCVLFCTVFTPLGLLFRLLGRDALGLRRQPERTTYWSDKPATGDVRSYFRQS